MRYLRFLLVLPLALMLGCVYSHEGSDNADREQIQAHLRDQLHCSRLELHTEGPGKFAGNGHNDQGHFTIVANREAGRIRFEGHYTQSGNGEFKGTATWNRTHKSFFGLKSSRFSNETTISPQ